MSKGLLTSGMPNSSRNRHPVTRESKIPSRQENDMAGICIHTSRSREQLEGDEIRNHFTSTYGVSGQVGAPPNTSSIELIRARKKERTFGASPNLRSR